MHKICGWIIPLAESGMNFDCRTHSEWLNDSPNMLGKYWHCCIASGYHFHSINSYILEIFSNCINVGWRPVVAHNNIQPFLAWNSEIPFLGSVYRWIWSRNWSVKADFGYLSMQIRYGVSLLVDIRLQGNRHSYEGLNNLFLRYVNFHGLNRTISLKLLALFCLGQIIILCT